MIARVLAGVAGGVATAALLLFLTRQALAAIEGKVYALEHGVIYQAVVLGAGFGAVCGAILGRNRPPS